jgi:tellurite resistance protein TerC
MEIIGLGANAFTLGFLAFVLGMLALDLGLFHRRDHAVGTREALAWSGVRVALALAFGAGVWWLAGGEKGMEFLSAYLVEKSLSVDNVFVFSSVFGALGIPALYQHRVLFWGILTALVLRAAMIVGGAALLERFHWIAWVFAALLVLTGAKLWLARSEAPSLEGSRALRLARRLLPATDGLRGARFLVRERGRWLATPLLVALILVEGADVVFALDSIPAVFAVSTDTFVVFTSNVFAILGLRSLYFLLAGLVDRLVYLRPALAAILVLIGVKMALATVRPVPAPASLGAIGAILTVAVVASLRRGRRSGRAAAPPRGAEPVA